MSVLALYSPALVALAGGVARVFCDGVVLYAALALLLLVSLVLHAREHRRRHHG